MKYYKLYQDNTIIGAISSDNFIQYSPVVDCFLRSNEVNGEYISFQGKLYRDTWMSPIQLQQDYTMIQTIEITEEEYEIYKEAMDNHEPIEDPDEPVQPVVPDPVNPIDTASLEYIRDSKINEMSRACRTTIEAGFDLEIRDETHHFSLGTQDQLNLMTLNVLAQTEELIPYHADGETCVFYTADEIKQIVATATQFKIYHTTYYNMLKTYINALETIEEIAAITYGTPVPAEYQSDVWNVITE